MLLLYANHNNYDWEDRFARENTGQFSLKRKKITIYIVLTIVTTALIKPNCVEYFGFRFDYTLLTMFPFNFFVCVDKDF